MEKDEQIRFIQKLTGGAETNDGHEHLMSSVNISSNSSKFRVSESRNETQLNLDAASRRSAYSGRAKGEG